MALRREDIYPAQRPSPRPMLDFAEFWESGAIDPAVWATTAPATGTLAVTNSTYGWRCGIIPNANEVGGLASQIAFPVSPTLWGPNTTVRKLVFEFMAMLANVANMDNALTILGGLTTTQAHTRAVFDWCGFALVGDALQIVTDDGGAETVQTGFGETLTDMNLYRMEVVTGQITFFLNGAQLGTPIITNLPDSGMFVRHYVDTEGGGAASLYVLPIRLWTEDVP